LHHTKCFDGREIVQISPLELKLKDNKCALYIEGYQLFRLDCNHLGSDDVRQVIIEGERRDNERGPGYIYKLGVIEVVARWKPCHCHATTIYNKAKDNNQNKSKNQRKRKYMEREREKTCPRCDKADLEFGAQALEISGKVIGEFQGLGCPNCRYICFDEKTSKKICDLIKESNICPIDPADLVLLLLYSYDGPICGAISFMKEAFLLVQEKIKEYKIPVLAPKFISYHYGPYSFDIVESWYNLEQLGLMKIEGTRSSPKEIFSLTEEGKEAAKRIFASLPEDLQKDLPAWRKGLDQLGNRGILKDVYRRYPEYTNKSKIKDEVLPNEIHGRA
jgi:hypothetical protein